MSLFNTLDMNDKKDGLQWGRLSTAFLDHSTGVPAIYSTGNLDLKGDSSGLALVCTSPIIK